MHSNNTTITKVALSVSVVLLLIAMDFCIDQLRAELSWPTEPNFTRQKINIPMTDKYAALRRAISISPENASYHILLGKHIVYESVSDIGRQDALLNEAVTEYDRAVFLNPSFTDALSYLAWSEFSVGKPIEALHHLETATKFDPNNYFNHLFYGICVSKFMNVIPDYLRKTYFRRAEIALERGVSLHPRMASQPLVLSASVDFYMRRGDLTSAIAVLERVGPPDSSTLSHHLRLASLYLRSNITDKSIRKYSFLLRNTSLKKDLRREIIKNLRADASAHQGVAELRYLLGNALVEDGQWSSAIETLKGLAAEGFRPAQTHFLLAQAYEGLGQRKSAYDEYVNTLNYQRNHPVASKKVVELFRDSP